LCDGVKDRVPACLPYIAPAWMLPDITSSLKATECPLLAPFETALIRGMFDCGSPLFRRPGRLSASNRRSHQDASYFVRFQALDITRFVLRLPKGVQSSGDQVP
jgi:hypothetical protein